MPRVDELLARHAPWASVDRAWPLTPFEFFLWADDRPRYPLIFEITMRCEGPIDAAAMRDAWRFALGRHPLLRATIRAQARGAEWVAPAMGWPELDVYTKDQASPPICEWIDLVTSTGLRGALCETPVGWDVKLWFHHACCDGQGARMFIQDLLLAYATLRGECRDEDPFFTLDARHLDRRHEYPPTVGISDSTWRKVREGLQFHFRPPRPAALDEGVSVKPADAVAPQSVIGFCSHTFTPEIAAQLQDPQRRSGASLNDLAVTLLFGVLGEWQLEHGLAPSSRLRVMIPFDLRSREDERMPAANRFTYTFINRRVGECRDGQALLAGVQSELQILRKTRFGVEFLDGLALAMPWPSILRTVLRRPNCFATAVITNLSNPARRLRKRLDFDSAGCVLLGRTRIYDLQVQTPPLRPETRWGFGLFEYADRLTVTFRYDATTLLPATAQQVLSRYIAAWRPWLEETSAQSEARADASQS